MISSLLTEHAAFVFMQSIGLDDDSYSGEIDRLPGIIDPRATMIKRLFDQFVEAISAAATSSGNSCFVVHPELSWPFHFILSGQGLNSITMWVYLKSLTFAYRTDPDEYRIQVKSADLPLSLNPSGPTILLGYYQPDNLFVGFDPSSVSIGASTQLSGGYVSLRSVRKAKRDGLTFDRDRRDRIAVGIRPDMLVTYALIADELHAAADDADITDLLQAAMSAFKDPALGLDELEDQVAEFSPARKKLIRKVRTYTRDSGFRTRVLAAYNSQCAITGMQLALVEAAHILPVSVQGSTDLVSNGIPLLATYHRAFDAGLIYLAEDHVMRLNTARVGQLRAIHLDRGLDEFVQTLGPILRPKGRKYLPDTAMIRQANVVRKIEGV